MAGCKKPTRSSSAKGKFCVRNQSTSVMGRGAVSSWCFSRADRASKLAEAQLEAWLPDFSEFLARFESAVETKSFSKLKKELLTYPFSHTDSVYTTYDAQAQKWEPKFRECTAAILRGVERRNIQELRCELEAWPFSQTEEMWVRGVAIRIINAYARLIGVEAEWIAS